MGRCYVGRRRREGWRILMVRSATTNVHLQSSTVWGVSGVAWWYGTYQAMFVANLLSTLIFHHPFHDVQP